MTRGERGGDYKGKGEGFAGTMIKDTWTITMGDGNRGGLGRRMGIKVQGIRGINGRYKIDQGRIRIVWEMEKPKNLYI